jgi:beta-glucanase (GH16 family)
MNNIFCNSCKRIKFNYSVILITVFALFLSPVKIKAQCTQLIWADEFNVDGPPNPANWVYEVGNLGLNNELQHYTNRPENSIVQGGVLKIKAIKENYLGSSYTSARIISKGKYDFKYGRVEARAKLPAGVGTWPAIWMLGNNIDQVSWPACGEIDIMEHVGKNLNRIYGTLHYPGRSGGNANGNSTIINDATTQFHVYALDWTASAIKIYVDGILYHTVPNSNSIPFNHNFFFLLNVAMGGDFGGPIVDPAFTSASMEIDYIRVYNNGYSISGPTNTLANQTNIYTIENIQGVTYNWTVPAGATIVSGNGTNSITVNWGNTAGNVSVGITSINNCTSGNQTSTYLLPVKILQTSEIYEDYQLIHNISFNNATGTYTPYTPNPNTSGMNNSSNVGKYDRNGGQLYDNISFVTSINNVADFKAGTKQFAMDVYTSAPIGTQITWQLENSAKATGGNYPTGRNSFYTATIEQTNTWHTLIFNYNSSPDSNTLDSEVDRFIFLCNPNSNTNNIYYFDNIKSLSTNNLAVANFDLGASYAIKITPNPANQFFSVNFPYEIGVKEIVINDASGRIVLQKNLNGNEDKLTIDISNIPTGIYLLSLKSDKNIWTNKMIKE